MADIASANVTYTLVSRAVDGGRGLRHNCFTVAFGNGALTYPSGGIPLLKASLGCPNSLSELHLIDEANANGLTYKYDATNEKLRIYEGDYAQAGDAPLVELDAGSDAPAAATLRILAVGY